MDALPSWSAELRSQTTPSVAWYVGASGTPKRTDSQLFFTAQQVWYLGSHSWFYAFNAASDPNTQSGQQEYASQYNGRRAYLNMILTPARRPGNCLLNICPADQSCPSAPVLGTCETCHCENNLEVFSHNDSMVRWSTSHRR